MRAGDLRKRITIEQRSASQSASGEQSHAWTLVAVVSAAVEPMSGRELEKAQAVFAEVSHQVLIRWRPGITAKMRVSYDGRLFNIGAVIDENERHRQLTLLCVEGLSEG